MIDESMSKEEMLLWRDRFIKGSFLITSATLLFFVASHFFGFIKPTELYAMNRLFLIAALLLGFCSGCLGLIIRRDIQGSLEGLAVGCGGGIVAASEFFICYRMLADTIFGAFGLGLMLPLFVFCCTSIILLFLFHKLSLEIRKSERAQIA